ncbi:conjugal transfer protein [Streptomyces sp. NPDC046984]|uniref:conjugal transfer protein n=1 Tax=Streptomyces sp. NPDC046984 TaxID=3155138 RepID=UPI0033EF0919
MSPGKQASPGVAAAPMAAGARLEAMRRRAHVSRLAVWTVIAAGPIALAVAVASTPTTVAAAPAAKPTAVHTVHAADPGGYAQLFVGAWLRSSADTPTAAQARLAQSMAPNVELPDPAADAQSAPQSVTAVRSTQRGAGDWLVTVAAQYADGSVRYYTVSMAADASGSSFAVTGAPGVVAGPARAEVPKSAYSVTVPEGGLSSAVGEFFGAYLTGAGEVDRYLAPGVNLTAVSPAPYRAVTVQRVSAIEEATAVDQVPSDGTEVRVLASVEARDETGRWPLTYELALKARSGRWDVAALEAGSSQGGGER